jgi:preprotein translocase subunit SecA
MNVQREAIYGLRRQVLEGDNIEEVFNQYIEEIVEECLTAYASKSMKRGDWDFEGLNDHLSRQFGFQMKFDNGLDPANLNFDKLRWRPPAKCSPASRRGAART